MTRELRMPPRPLPADVVRGLLADDADARTDARRWLAEVDSWRTFTASAAGPFGPCAKDIGHGGRCRNQDGSTWEGRCNAAEHPRHATTQPTLDLGAAS